MIDDYINELEAYKYNLDRDYLRLEKENQKLNQKYLNAVADYETTMSENQKLKKQNETIQEKFKEWKKDIEKERKFYLCERDCSFRLKESKKYLSYTQQIEKLQQENQELKKELEEKNKPQIFIDTQDIEERYAEGLYQDYLEEENKKYKNQQKEFIDYINSYIKLLSDDPDYIEERQKDILEEILSKYYEIIDK